MTHRIIIQISVAAQRAAIVAGGNAAREQTFSIGQGQEEEEARARLLALPAKWTAISERGEATVVVPARAKVSPQHYAGAPFGAEDWRPFGSYLDETIDLAAPVAPANAEEALAYAEGVASLSWLDAARAERVERLARDRKEADERAEAERPLHEARRAEAERAKREREAVEEREAAEDAKRRAQLGALFGEAGHPERARFDAGAMTDEEIENAVETRLTCWLPPPDLETGAFAPLSIDAHRYQVATMRPGQGRTVAKLATGQEAFAFFGQLEARAKAWADKAPGRSVEMWRARCDCGQPLADVLVRDGLIVWDGWIALGEPGPDGHPEVA